MILSNSDREGGFPCTFVSPRSEVKHSWGDVGAGGRGRDHRDAQARRRSGVGAVIMNARAA